MRWAFLAAFLWTSVAHAASPLQGRWEIVMPTEPGFSGEILIDADGRVLFSGASVTLGKSGQSRGYVSFLSDKRAEITLAAGTAVGRMRCFIESRDVLNCDDVASNGRVADPYSLRRIGPGPASLLK